MLNGTTLSTSAASVLGIHTDAFPQAGLNALAIGGALTAIAALLSILVNRKAADEPPILRGTPIFGHWRFFSERYDFVNEGLRKLGSTFQFYMLGVRSTHVEDANYRISCSLSSSTRS